MNSSDDLQIDGNHVEENPSSSVVIIGHETMDFATGNDQADPDQDRYADRVYVFDNVFINNGIKPQGMLALTKISPLEDVVWDGSSNPDKERGAELCLTESPPSFRNLHRFLNLAEADADTTDSADHRCDLEELAPLEF